MKACGQEYSRSEDELELEHESQEDLLVLRRRSSVHALHPRRMSAVHLQEQRGDKAEEIESSTLDRVCQLDEFSNATEWNFDTQRSKLIPLMNQLVETHIEQGSREINKDDVSIPSPTTTEALHNGPGKLPQEALQHLIQLAQHAPRAGSGDKSRSPSGDSLKGNIWPAAETEFAAKKENPFVLGAEQEDATPVLDRSFLKNRSKKLLAKLTKQKSHV